MKLVVMKNGGQPGSVAVNPALITHVRSASGPFTDICFGEFKVAVQGTFEQVVAQLNDDPAPDSRPDVRSVLPIR